MVIEPHLANRSWVAEEKNGWTYAFGDTRAMAGLELTLISKPVHDLLMATREQSEARLLSHKDRDFYMISMDKFNRELVAWGDYWSGCFASRKCRILPNACCSRVLRPRTDADNGFQTRQA
jgi:hypothetical protein